MASGQSLCSASAESGYGPTGGTHAPYSENARGEPVRLYGASTDAHHQFDLVLPTNYAGGGLTVDIYWDGESATSGSVVWNAAFERNNAGATMTSDNFSSAQAATTTTAGSAGVSSKTTITFTDGSQMASIAAGDPFRIRITRDADNGSDTMTGNARLYLIAIKET